jgi:hypothetical protein
MKRRNASLETYANDIHAEWVQHWLDQASIEIKGVENNQDYILTTNAERQGPTNVHSCYARMKRDESRRAIIYVGLFKFPRWQECSVLCDDDAPD